MGQRNNSRDGSIDVKGTEVNSEKGLKIKHFREMEIFFRLSDFCVLGVWELGKSEG